MNLSSTICVCGNLKVNQAKNCRVCADKLHSKRMTGKNNPMFGIKRIGVNSPHYIDGRKNKIYYCKKCKIKEISYYTYWWGKARCQSCAKKEDVNWNSEFNPNWNNGSSFEPYPLGWNNTFKEQIRYRDKYKCQNCGKPEIENNRKLSIHHIDYNKENLAPNNLISLCQSCHSKTNFNREYWKKYYTQTL